jgi:hypothetical protein
VILPTFLVVGAPRCGTTSLHYYLRQHPQICMSAIKEPNFFLFGPRGENYIAEPGILKKSVRSLSEYGQLFRTEPQHRAVGEVSPLYLSVRQAAARILATCGIVQIICLVRSPAERAWSHFLHAFPEFTGDAATAEFARLVRAEMARGPDVDEPYRTRTHLVRTGLYAQQVERYRETFGDDAVLVLLMDDLEAAPAETLADICEFVGVDPDHPFETTKRFNLSGTRAGGAKGAVRQAIRRVQPTVKAILPPKLAGRLGRLRVALDDRATTGPAPIDPQLRAEINEWCRSDIERLSTMIGRDLSSWLEPPSVRLAS